MLPSTVSMKDSSFLQAGLNTREPQRALKTAAKLQQGQLYDMRKMLKGGACILRRCLYSTVVRLSYQIQILPG